jgi:hypothetical protein
MGLLSRGLHHLVMMIAVTGTAAASDDLGSAATLELSPLVVQGEIQRPSVVSFITRQTLSQQTTIPLERSFLGEIVVAVAYLPK